MSESSACNISDNELQKSTTLKLFANAILCQKCVQMSQRTMIKALGWMQSSSLCTKGWCAGCPLRWSPGRRESRQGLAGAIHWFCAPDTLEVPFPIARSSRKAVWWHDSGGLGTEERTVLYALSRRRQSQPGSSWNSDPASQTRNPLNPTLTGGAAFVHPMHTCWSGSSSILPHFRNS